MVPSLSVNADRAAIPGLTIQTIGTAVTAQVFIELFLHFNSAVSWREDFDDQIGSKLKVSLGNHARWESVKSNVHDVGLSTVIGSIKTIDHGFDSRGASLWVEDRIRKLNKPADLRIRHEQDASIPTIFSFNCPSINS